MRIILTLALLSCINFSFAAPNPPPPTPPPGSPIDGGIWVLFAISILLGFYKIYNTKKSVL